MRRLLNPLLKLFFNPNTIVHALHQQADLNKHFARTMAQARIDRRGLELALLRGAPQPRARDDAGGRRDQEPQDAGRGALEPPRLLGTPRARARRGRAVPARGGGAARTASRSAGARSAGSVEPAGVPGPGAGAGTADSGGPGGDGRRRRRRRRGRRGPGMGLGPGGPGGEGGVDADGADGADGGDDGGDDAPETSNGAAAGTDAPDPEPQAS